jgi:hypothetical protein
MRVKVSADPHRCRSGSISNNFTDAPQMAKVTAQIGTWYRDLQNDMQFEVVALDDTAQTIEVQLLDGEICEYDFDTWRDMLVLPIDAPEDWRHVYELGSEDGQDPDLPYYPRGQYNPLDMIEPSIIYGIDDLN